MTARADEVIHHMHPDFRSGLEKRAALVGIELPAGNLTRGQVNEVIDAWLALRSQGIV